MIKVSEEKSSDLYSTLNEYLGVFGGLVTNQDFLDTFNNPKPVELGFIVSTYNLGCIVGCALMFAVGAHFGRRHAIWAAMSFITVGAVIQASAYTVRSPL